MDHVMIARVYALVAEMEQHKAEIEGMVAENYFREACGDSFPYGEDEFFKVSKQLAGISRELEQLGHE